MFHSANQIYTILYCLRGSLFQSSYWNKWHFPWLRFTEIKIHLYVFIPADIDECGEDAPCGPHANCTNTAGSYSCRCHRGYLKGAEGCQGPSAEMMFVCVCVRTWWGIINGGVLGTRVSLINFHFADVDECAVAAVTGLRACNDNAACTNTLGSFGCSCPVGYVMAQNEQNCEGKFHSATWHLFGISVMSRLTLKSSKTIAGKIRLWLCLCRFGLCDKFSLRVQNFVRSGGCSINKVELCRKNGVICGVEPRVCGCAL